MNIQTGTTVRATSIPRIGDLDLDATYPVLGVRVNSQSGKVTVKLDGGGNRWYLAHRFEPVDAPADQDGDLVNLD